MRGAGSGVGGTTTFMTWLSHRAGVGVRSRGTTLMHHMAQSRARAGAGWGVGFGVGFNCCRDSQGLACNPVHVF